MKTTKLLLVAIVLTIFADTVQAQFLKKIGEAVKQSAQSAVTRKTEQKTEEAVNKGVDKATDPETYKGKRNKKDKNATSAEGSDQQGNTLQTSKKATTQKLESYTEYDFVPGDQILFFEDFSQDAIGDFPALWSSNATAEVKTVNIASGKWFHLVGDDGVFCFNNEIAFPSDFILEFDVILPHFENDATHSFRIVVGIYDNADKKEFQDGLYPGNSGWEFIYNSKGWRSKGYSDVGNFMMEAASERNLVQFETVNHVIVWVQNRRVRVYSQGAKVIDSPTNLPQTFKPTRMRLFQWDAGEVRPMYSNIKVTTAAPDTRSKLLTEGKLVSYGIYFDSGKDIVKPESYGALNDIAKVLKENPGIKVQIVGHTDSDGNEASNLDLSRRRAAAVEAELVKTFGVSGAMLSTDGAGQSQPVAPNATPEGKAKNCRVEFIKL